MNYLFTVKLYTQKKCFNANEIIQLECLLERTLKTWNSNLIKRNNIPSEKVRKFWKKGCNNVEVFFEEEEKT